MTLIVEDGTGIAGAEAYASVAYADAYWAARPQSPLSVAWAAATTATKEGGMREGADYLDAEYGDAYRGTKAGTVQGRLWPRSNANDDAGYPLPGLPTELKNANCELAARAITAPLVEDLDRGGKIQTVKAGAVAVTYSDTAPAGTTYGIVSKMLIPVLKRRIEWEWR